MAFPKKQRITRKIDFEKIFSQGKAVQNSFFFMYALKNQLGFNRFASIVSSKISSKAVVRNKIRRRVLEASRKILNKINSGFDIIISVRPKVKDQKFSELEDSLIDILKKANIF